LLVSNKNIQRIEQLDGLRGIFAFMVLLLHFPVVTFFTNNFLVRQSYLFVDFFFVLSGFIISSNYYKQINNLSDFKKYLLKRLIRLYPQLFYSVVIYFLYLMIGEFYLQDLKVDHRPLSIYIYELFDSLFFLNSTPLLGTSQGINPPSWSISAEIISYLVFGFGMVVFRNHKVGYSLIILILCISFMVQKNSYVFNNGDFGFVRGLLGFNFGVLTFILSQKIRVKSPHCQLPLILLLLITFYTIDFIKIELLKLILPILFAALIYVLLYKHSFLNTILRTRFMQFLGKISYSLYLNHYLILMISYIIFFRLFGIPNCEPYSTFVLFISIIVTIIYSYFTYLFIEKSSGKLIYKLITKLITK
jgi:peptidoglycan/LPS O-acetylase OafA/YrhL